MITLWRRDSPFCRGEISAIEKKKHIFWDQDQDKEVNPGMSGFTCHIPEHVLTRKSEVRAFQPRSVSLTSVAILSPLLRWLEAECALPTGGFKGDWSRRARRPCVPTSFSHTEVTGCLSSLSTATWAFCWCLPIQRGDVVHTDFWGIHWNRGSSWRAVDSVANCA